MDELVSVVVPLYNSEKYVREMLDSIVSQTYNNIEIIIVDDGSIDKSSTIVNEIKSNNDKKIKYYYQKNQGAPAARNYGLDLASGEYVVFFDADDYMEKDSIEKLHNSIYKSGSDIVIGEYLRINSSGEMINYNEQAELRTKILESAMLDNQYLALFLDPLPGNKMFRRNFLLDNNILFSSLKIGQDLNFFLKVMSRFPKISLVNEVVFHYRVHDEGISRTLSMSILDIVKCFDDLEAYNKAFVEANFRHINTLKFNHYSFHLYKVPFYTEKSDRTILYKELKKAYSKIKFKNINYEQIVVNRVKVMMALKFKYIFTSDLLHKYYLKF